MVLSYKETSVRHTVENADTRSDWTNTRETSMTRVSKLPSLTHAQTGQKPRNFRQ